MGNSVMSSHAVHRLAPGLLMCLILALASGAGAAQAPVLTVKHRARALQPGELVVLTISSVMAMASVAV